MSKASNRRAVVLSCAVLGALPTSAAFAAIKAVGAGVSMPTPMGDASQTLNRPLGFQAEAWIDALKWLPSTADFHVEATYQPYSLRNSASLGVTLIGLFGGLQASGGATFAGISPFLSLDAGAVFSTLDRSSSSGSTSNNSLNFALQAVPGIDFPVFGNLGGVVELPLQVVFQKSVLAVWNGSFSLRWKL